MNIGILYAVTAFIMWGLAPIYLKALIDVPPLELLAQRTLWSLVLLLAILLVRRQWQWVTGLWRQPRVLAGFACSALLLAANWGIYIWAVNSGHVLDASLGYFINPLVNVLLGLLVLKERLRTQQWVAIMLAALGVAWLTYLAGRPPWIGLMLALTFGMYGLLRKTARLGPLEGAALETGILVPVASLYLLWQAQQGTLAFVTAPVTTQWLLIALGPLTAIPLLLFASGARKISLSALGIVQYVSPTLQLLLAVWLYKEPFDSARLLGFAFIWAGLILYSAEGIWYGWLRKSKIA